MVNKILHKHALIPQVGITYLDIFTLQCIIHYFYLKSKRFIKKPALLAAATTGRKSFDV